MKFIKKIFFSIHYIIIGFFLKKIKNSSIKFNLIYHFGYWKSHNSSSFSGTGSNLQATENLRVELQEFLKRKNIKTFLDVPCGDWFWMKLMNLNNINYVGADIVDSIVKKNNKLYENSNIKFKKIDIINNNIEKYDLVFIRDCFVHLSNEDIYNSINNILISNSKYLATTIFLNNYSNQENKKADNWRPINLMEKPFNFPEPDYLLNDKSNQNEFDKHKHMGIWEINKLKDLFK
jgi:SAM-dependent methyltransferase